ncbi:unnamed protein product [Mycena citricolor]|uniref:SH3 domain-containing protein n=1 Tax=Mycena citricolor TaxID=2018698 RepID=A0AAD2H5Q6_9AGAR|nr:unnamed protein product [Mycena citricolor]
MDVSALVSHIITQTRQNVEFLMSQNHISPSEGREILARLPNTQSANRTFMTSPPPGGQLVRGRALWGYNENSQNPNDLAFRAGDEIEILSENNPDWWTGRHNGRQGLFPSNYVEKRPGGGGTYPPQGRDGYSNMPIYQPPPPPGPANNGYPGGYGPGYQAGQPPAPYMPYGAPAPIPPAPIPPASAPPELPPKQSKFGGLGATLANSAVGGLGFGAGSAIGGDIVHAIF